MTDSARDQLDALKQQIDREAPISSEPVLQNVAEQGRQAADFARGLIAEQTEGLAQMVRERPLTAAAVALLGGYVLGRVGRYI
jgi:hypothetical protein